ncbi:Zn-ribbon domain-containing OB-fold protein [Microbacterium sp. No. 7]|uniref:Zn-ribbon domain-containing OB-fold protein n=1 Tax=Microbacterium sp. No. 7 TaxID=1714373 RepID=UPI0006D1B344|nr:OB-fold domain-containing protein [Microbacterium sp. No. 7]ALJ21949.1 hypothetical protein AOA12_19445 [Microbacterium sp. No. 7]
MSTTTAGRISLPIPDLESDGLLAEFPEGHRLVGSVCDDCGQAMLGSRVVCSSCVGGSISRTALPATGVLYSFTRLSRGDGGIRALGYVDLDNGVRTLTDLRDSPELGAGIRVRLDVDPDGAAWFFAAVAGEEQGDGAQDAEQKEDTHV